MPTPDLFSRRVHFKPYEYSHLLKYKDAIRQSYWVHDEFNFDSDVQDYKVNCTPAERNAIKNTMLAIAQIEVSVKTFWSKVYDRMPKSEIAQVGMSFAECHKEGTEVLTAEGWTDFRDVTKDTLVAQVDPETTEVSFVKPTRVVNKPYKGDLHTFDQETRRFAVTPNHRFLYKVAETDALRESKVKDMTFNGLKLLPATVGHDPSGEYVRDELSPKDKLCIVLQVHGRVWQQYTEEDELVKCGLTDGCHTYDMKVPVGPKEDRLLDLLKRADLTYRVYDHPQDEYQSYEIDVPSSWEHIDSFGWVNFPKVTAGWCRSFLDELSLWDESVVTNTGEKGKTIKYLTTKKDCADVVHAVSVFAGYKSTRFVDEQYDSPRDLYRVYVKPSNSFVASIQHQPETESYDGRVYCVTVPTGCIVTRYEGAVLISGNSEVRHSDAYAHLLELLGLNEEFERIHHIPEIRDRIRYLDKYVGGEGQSDKDYMITVMLFSLFVEYVSLFSQFLIMMSFDKYKKQFKGICNAVEATSKEEELHALFGMELINICRKERPEWFDGSFEADAYRACKKAFEAEQGVLDWIFEAGELDHLPRDVVDAYLKDKFNDALEQVDLSPLFEPDEDLLAETDWFREEVLTTKDNDFFQKRGTAYSKMTQSATADDLF